ncbi:carbohydrate kinase family protein [Arthrobacter bambusae]|uniref:carbohydrate kinase family protein n=1 Tax=Arthrobacter bambusae TaxID=1338426 RepID=UPI00278703BB|nr:carbohydrate kinase [Arthrobacter bambusae]MDQ0028757.1 fructokinase [Arthrobacter bambusae]MDQ0096450.1 fructokinase [Arthrobacter bambusae]
MPTHQNGPQSELFDDGALVTVIGESLVDIIDDPLRGSAAPQAHPGGSPLNVAVGCARLDLRTTLVTHFAEDSRGEVIAEHLENNGVGAIVGGSLPTSTALASLDATGAAQYTFSISWDINGAAIPALAAVKGSLHVHTGSIATVLHPGKTSVRGLIEAARPHATVSFDPNCRPAISSDVTRARQQAEDFVAVSDVAKASDEDLHWLYPGRTLDEAMEAWLNLGPSIVALTRGAQGPVILSRTGRVEMPGDVVTVEDTVGAGDSFMAGLISGLAQMGLLGAEARERLNGLTQNQLHALAAYANRAAAITCSRKGANPPTSAELGALTGSYAA